jgi:hypothetical protein
VGLAQRVRDPDLSPANGTTIGCDCSVAEGEPSPLHVVWWTNPDDDAPRRTAESLGQMVVWWLGNRRRCLR